MIPPLVQLFWSPSDSRLFCLVSHATALRQNLCSAPLVALLFAQHNRKQSCGSRYNVSRLGGRSGYRGVSRGAAKCCRVRMGFWSLRQTALHGWVELGRSAGRKKRHDAVEWLESPQPAPLPDAGKNERKKAWRAAVLIHCYCTRDDTVMTRRTGERTDAER